MWPIRTVRACCAGAVATAVALVGFATGGAHAAGTRETSKPQAYPVPGLFHPCSGSVTPDWHYGETNRHYQSDGTLQFTNRTDHAVDYTASVKTSTNHKIDSNSVAKLPPKWNTTLKTELGIVASNGWQDKETFGPVKLGPGESFRVEYGVTLKNFVGMFLGCRDGYLQPSGGAGVIQGTAPAERYAYALVIHKDGSISDRALSIPSRGSGKNSRVVDDRDIRMAGPNLEKLADPSKDVPVEPTSPLRRDPSWPKQGQRCPARGWYPLDISGIDPLIRQPGYSQDFLNWSKGQYHFTPVTDTVVGAQFAGYENWNPAAGGPPRGWLESVGAIYRAYLPVKTVLKGVDLAPGEKVHVEYGTLLRRVNYREVGCQNGVASIVSHYELASAPAGFWAEATITGANGTKRTVDVTPDAWKHLPVPTQTTR